MLYTKNQQHYIAVFMQQVDVVIALMDTPQPTSIDTALDTANEVINAANTAVGVATTVLSVAGIAAAVPTAGLSLPAAGAVITAVQVGNAGYKFVKQQLYGDDINPLAKDYMDKENKQLALKVLCREVASTIAATRYRHIIEVIVTDKGIAEFARYGVARTLKKTFKDTPLLDNLPTAEVILDYLYESTNLAKTKTNPTISVKETYSSGSDYYAKLAYARPRAVSISFSNGRAHYDFYAPKNDRGLQSRIWDFFRISHNTTMANYGYMALPKASLSAYLEKREAQLLAPSSELDAIKPHLCVSYSVTREEVEAYLLEVRTLGTTSSLNVFLEHRFSLRIIAECHDDRLASLPLHGGNFSGVNFRCAILSGCTLRNTNWTGAHLDGTTIGGTLISLQGSIFKNITAEKSHWENVDFANSDFSEARMNGAHLKSCSLQHIISINSLWYLAEMENMTVDASSFATRLNEEEKARLQLECRVTTLEETVADHDQRLDETDVWKQKYQDDLMQLKKKYADSEENKTKKSDIDSRLEKANIVQTTVEKEMQDNSPARKESQSTAIICIEELAVKCIASGYRREHFSDKREDLNTWPDDPNKQLKENKRKRNENVIRLICLSITRGYLNEHLSNEQKKETTEVILQDSGLAKQLEEKILLHFKNEIDPNKNAVHYWNLLNFLSKELLELKFVIPRTIFGRGMSDIQNILSSTAHFFQPTRDRRCRYYNAMVPAIEENDENAKQQAVVTISESISKYVDSNKGYDRDILQVGFSQEEVQQRANISR